MISKEIQNYCTIYLVRHGETEHNINEIIQGQTDSPLTAKGEEQAKSRAEDFKRINFDAIFASDLGRTRRTAEILKLNRELEINTTKLLREKFFGNFEGKPAEDFRKKSRELLEQFKILSDPEKMKFKYEPTQESDDESASRMLTFLREISAAYIGKTVLVVSHGSITRSFLKKLGFFKYDDLPGGAMENLGYVVLLSDGVDFFIKELVGIKKTSID